MADDATQFRFDFGGVKLVLSGDREFVERMYQKVMQDVQVARERVKARPASASSSTSAQEKQILERKKPSIWVHRCGDMMRKIYMATREDVGRSPLGQILDPSAFEKLYMDRDVFPHFFPELEGGYTLWAEFTTVGRQKIAEATSPKRAALKK